MMSLPDSSKQPGLTQAQNARSGPGAEERLRQLRRHRVELERQNEALREAASQPLSACLINGDNDSCLKQQAQEAGLVLLHKPVRPDKLRNLLGHLCPNLAP